MFLRMVGDVGEAQLHCIKALHQGRRKTTLFESEGQFSTVRRPAPLTLTGGG